MINRLFNIILGIVLPIAMFAGIYQIGKFAGATPGNEFFGGFVVIVSAFTALLVVTSIVCYVLGVE